MMIGICITVYIVGLIALMVASRCYENSNWYNEYVDLLLGGNAEGGILRAFWPILGPFLVVVIIVGPFYLLYNYALQPLVNLIAKLICPHAK